jgi:hypothetical protein
MFKVPVKRLVARPCHTLHPMALHWIAVVVGALNLISTPHVAVVRMRSPGSRQWDRTLFKKNVVSRTCGVWSLYPNQIPHKDVYPKLVAERGLSHVLVGTKEVPLPCSAPLCWMRKLVRSIVIRQSLPTALSLLANLKETCEDK